MGNLSSSARSGAASARADMQATAAAKTDLNEVAVFTKFIKKAEETAQAAL